MRRGMRREIRQKVTAARKSIGKSTIMAEGKVKGYIIIKRYRGIVAYVRKTLYKNTTERENTG